MNNTHQPRSMFPILKNDVILQIMEEVNVPLTEMELTEPGRFKERVREVFVQLLNICWGFTDPTALTKLPTRIHTAQSRLPHPELYDDALPEVKFLSLLSKQLRVCGYYEFGFKDLAAPQAKRFRRQLSALINFLKYREDMANLESQATDEREELFAALDEVTENNMKLKEDLEYARAMYDEKMMEREQAEAECKEMEAEIAQHNKNQSSIRQETSLLKKSVNELKDRIANLSIALRELQAEERQLSKEVVHSPDRIKLDLANATSKLEKVKKDILERQREKQLVQKRAEHTAQAEEQCKDMVQVLEKMEQRVSEYEMVVEDLEEVQSRLEGVECDLEGRREEKEGQERQLGVVEQQKADTISTLSKALQTSQNELDSTVARLGKVESERLDGIARIESCERRIEELRVEMEQKQRDAERDLREKIESFRKFEKAYWAKEQTFHAQIGYLS